MRRFIGVALALFAAAMLPAIVAAQDAAAVTGVVSDPGGAAIVGADVLLVNTTTKAAYASRTNALGAYRIANVTPGPGYRLTFRMAGFGRQVINDIYLTDAAPRTQNAVLKPGAVSTASESSGAMHPAGATVSN